MATDSLRLPYLTTMAQSDRDHHRSVTKGDDVRTRDDESVRTGPENEDDVQITMESVT